MMDKMDEIETACISQEKGEFKHHIIIHCFHFLAGYKLHSLADFSWLILFSNDVCVKYFLLVFVQFVSRERLCRKNISPG